MSDALTILLRLNLAMGAAVALAMALRLPARRMFGPGVAYGLWALVPLAVLAMLAPARTVTVVQAWAEAAPMRAAPAAAGAALAAPATGPTLAAAAAAVWLAGGLASLAWLGWRQVQFARALREGRAGPAVVGVLRPRIVTPADFARRYTAREQQVVLAHEETHIARHDLRANALVALVRCVNWFNPLTHVLAHYLRIDQELACDAQVVAAHPSARRAYAEAMLKTQLAARPLPLGCYWPCQSAHPLAQRIGLLARTPPGAAASLAGGLTVALLAVGVGVAAWAARPADIVFKPAPVGARAAPWPAPPPRATQHPMPAARAWAAPAPQRPAAADPPAQPPAEVEASAPAEPGRFQAAALDGPFEPVRKIHAVARRSSVEPGSAVRVVATMTDPEGAQLTTDLTAFGSQSFYRVGYVERNDSRYKLFTAVAQQGDRLLVTASLDERFDPAVSGSVVLAPGQTGFIPLPNGMTATVTPSVRPETPEEVAEGRRRDVRPVRWVDRLVDNL